MSLPRVYGGKRRKLLWRLVANGLAQAGLAFGVALLLRDALRPNPSVPHPLGLLAASGLALVALRIHAARVGERLGQDYVMRVRLRIFEALAAQPLRAKRGPRAGLTMTRVISDLGSLRSWVSSGLARSCVACVTLSASIAALAALRPLAGLVFAAVVMAVALAGTALAPVLRSSVREARRQRGRLAGELGEKLLAARSVRQLGQTRTELRRVRRRSERLRDALVRRTSAAEAIHALPDLVTPVGVALWILVAGPDHTRELAAGILLLGVLGAALRDLARAVDRRLNFEEGRRRIASLLDEPRLQESRHPRELPGGGPLSLELEGVSIDGLLRDVALRADAGDLVLVTGPTGQGKSTLLALVARLLDPGSGELRLDGHPLRSLALDSLHDAVQLVSPELPLMRGSVRQNLTYGIADDDDDAWLAQVAFACGLTYEPALAAGLATRVEERGQNLSAGLRARISLARAVAMRPRLLLVDEPAFALDDEAANALRRALALHPTTALVVAPETSELLDFDRVWILAGGRATERRAAARIHALEPAVARP